MSDWKKTTLGDVVTFQRGFDITRSVQREGLVPVVSSGGVSSFHDTAAVSGPGVVIGRKGTLGKTFYMQGDYWPHDTTLWVKDFKGNLPKFVYYFMSQLETSWLDAGSANPTLNRNHLHPISVLWPPIADQRAIAEVLGALDDKIAANTKIMDTTAALVRAKWSKLAADARRVPLERSVELGLSGVWGEDEKSENATVEVITLRGRDLEDLARRRDSKYPRRWISQTQLERRENVHAAEIWTAGSGSQLGPTVLVTPELRQSFDVPLLYSNFVKRLVARPGSEGAMASAWFALWNEWELNGFANYKVGTAFPNLDVAGLLRGVRVPVLPEARLANVRVWADVVLRPEQLQENRTLAKIRDALLPQLMSGKLRVRDAATAIEGVF
jgi:type I restriction enzyme, S subunit